jgi:hypothetical protein
MKSIGFKTKTMKIAPISGGDCLAITGAGK